MKAFFPKIGLILFLIFTLFSCDRIDEIKIVNATHIPIRFEICLDSSYENALDRLLKEENPQQIFHVNPLKNLDICYENAVDTARFREYFLYSRSKDGLWVYIFSDSLAQVTDSNDLKNKRVFSCRKYYSRKELRSTKWLITISDFESKEN